jgi:outer membrane protein
MPVPAERRDHLPLLRLSARFSASGVMAIAMTRRYNLTWRSRSYWWQATGTLTALLMVSPGTQAQLLSELHRSAAAIDPSIAGALAQVQAAEQRVLQAKGGLGPTATIVLSKSETRYREGPTFDLRQFSGKQAALQVTQPLFKPTLLSALEGAQAQLEQARAALTQAEADAAVRLVEACFEVLKSRDTITLMQAQKQAAEEQLAAAKRSYTVGTSTITDVREAEAKIDTVSAQMAAAEAALELHQQLLADISGRPAPELMLLGLKADRLPSIESTSVQAWIADAQSGSAQLQQAQRALDEAEAEVRKAWYGHAPSAELSYSYTMSSDTGTVTSLLPRRGDSSQVGVNVNFPLFASGATQARVREMVALRDKAQSEVETARRTVQTSVRQSFSAALTALALSRGLTTANRSLELALRSNKRGYEVGMKVNAEVLEAQSRLFEARRDLSRAHYDAWLNSVRLKGVAGKFAQVDLDELDSLLVPLTPAAWPSAPAVHRAAPCCPH